MKSFSLIALVALFFAAVVSAAPQHSSAALSSSSSHPTIREVISELSNIFTCVPNVVGQIIGDGDFKSEFTQFKQEFNAVLKHLPKCPKHEALNQKYNCITDSIKKFGQIFDGLINKVSVKNKDVAEEIQTELKGECVKNIPLRLKEFKCNAKGLDRSSIENGLTNKWKKFQQQIEKHLNAWKQCSFPFCTMKEMSYVLSLFVQYLESIENDPIFPKFMQDLLKITMACLASHNA